jgi:chemotaxis protein CheZ
MLTLKLSREECLDRAKTLVREIESADEEKAASLLQDFANYRDSLLFQEIGRLTRELHDALNGFRQDARLASLAQCEIPDAKERLNYVIGMTEQAARRTLTALDDSIPLSSSLGQKAEELRKEWERFTRRQMEPQEFRALSRRIDEFLGGIHTDSARLHTNLMEVLMAQEFQDLTGQVLNRVMLLVQQMEDSLVGMIKLSAQPMVPAPVPASMPGGEGPQINPQGRSDVVSGQDEVDDLLSSLGF